MAVACLRRPALPTSIRPPLIVAALGCAAVTLLLGITYAGTSSASPLDDRILGFADGISDSIPLGLVFDAAGEPKGAISLIAVISLTCVALGRWRLALLTVAGQGLIGSMTNLVKPLFDRTIHGPFLSFPSGHTAGATAFALVIGLLVADLMRARPPLASAIALGTACSAGAVAAWAQTILGAHYATDTIGGVCFALALIVPLALLLDALIERLTGMRWAVASQTPETS